MRPGSLVSIGFLGALSLAQRIRLILHIPLQSGTFLFRAALAVSLHLDTRPP